MKKKYKFTAKQDRQAMHVASSMKKKGMSAKKAKSVGYAVAQKGKSKKKKMDGRSYGKVKKSVFGLKK